MGIGEDVALALGARNPRPNGKGFIECKCPAHEDRASSLGVKTSAEGTLVVKCHAGCDAKHVYEALRSRGIKTDDKVNNVVDLTPKFWYEDARVGRFCSTFNGSIETIYLYHNRDGILAGFKVRFFGKEFRRYVHNAATFRNKAGKVMLPYRLPQIIEAAREGRAIHDFEGEKDADNAAELGIDSTTFGGVSDGLLKEYLVDLKVPWVIWADNDEPGLKAGAEKALALYRQGFRVKLVTSPFGKDFSDWKKGKNITIDDVAVHLEAIPEYRPAAEQLMDLEKDGKLPTSGYDLGTEAWAGSVYAQIFSEHLRYVRDARQWIKFDGKTWAWDVVGDFAESAKQLSGHLKEVMPKLDVSLRKSLEKLIDKSQTESGKNNILRMAQTEPLIRIEAAKLDGTELKDMMPCESGIINLKSGTIVAHHSSYLFTRRTPYKANFEDQPVEFYNFLHALFRDNAVVDWVLRYLAYCLTGQTSWQYFCAWNGKPNAGKSQLQIIMRSILGGLCADIDAESIILKKERTAGADSDLAGTAGARIIFCSELPLGGRLDERIVKALTGQDVLKVKFMGGNKFPLKTNGKLIFTANDRVRISPDDAMARRLCELRFEHPPANPIDDYGAKLLAKEGDRILGALIQLAPLTYYEHSLELPAQMRHWRESWLKEINTLAEWYSSRITPEPYAWASVKQLRDDYGIWCSNSGVHDDVTQGQFRRFLENQGLVECNKNIARGWSGALIKQLPNNFL